MSSPSSRTFRGWFVKAPSTLNRVVLPEPEGPIIATNSPLFHPEIHSG